MHRVTAIACASLVTIVIPMTALSQSDAEGDTASTHIEYKLANVVAKVNDHVITDDQLYQRMFRLQGAQVLGQMINELLIEDAAQSQNVEIPQKELDARFEELKGGFQSEEDFENWKRSQGLRDEDLKDQIKLGMLQERVIINARGLQVTEEEVKNFFDENKDRLGTPELFRCSHILVPTQAEADEVAIALEAGADFAKLASLKSQDAATKETGGDIGFVALAALAPELRQAVAELEVGAVSGVVSTNAGFHVIKLVEKTPAVAAEFDKAMKQEISQALLKSKVDAAMPEVMRELHENAKISISGVAGSP